MAPRTRKYLPDFIVLVDDGHGDDDLLHLIVEIKGYRREDAKEKKATMETYWVPGVNNNGKYGRWAFAEFTEVYQIEADFEAKVEAEFNKMIESVSRAAGSVRNQHGEETPKPEKKKTVETLTHEEASRKNIPTAEFQSVMRKEEQSPDPRGLRAPQPRPGPATGLARQGRAGLVRSGGARAAALHPGEGSSQGADRRPAAPQRGRPEGRGGPDRPLRRFQRPARRERARPSSTSTTPTGRNRMILGDSLQVMASLAEREGLRGKVQCIYIDPPYGIKFNSNFQWSTTSRDVKDGNVEHITREPEQVKAFRDTWRDGIHSYLTYLRDRLTVARDLLAESGSIFVQIGDENVHRVRALMDEVFGEENFVVTDYLQEDCRLDSIAIP